MSNLPILVFRTSIQCSKCKIYHLSYRLCDAEIRPKGYNFECQCETMLHAPFSDTKIVLNEMYMQEKERERVRSRSLSENVMNSPRFKPVLDSLFRRKKDE